MIMWKTGRTVRVYFDRDENVLRVLLMHRMNLRHSRH